MKARHPDRTGLAENQGVKIHYEVYGEDRDGVPLVFLSAFCVADVRMWCMQVPHFARHHPCVAYDPPGAGRSDRPTALDRFTPAARMADALAVMDAVGVDQAVVIGISQGGLTAPLLAVTAPERVLGLVLINPGVALNDDPRPTHDPAGWEHWFRAESIRGDYEGFLRFFLGEVLSEPYSSIGFDDALEWGRESSPESAISSLRGGSSRAMADPAGHRLMLEQVECRCLVVLGDDDRLTPLSWGEEIAQLLRTEPVVVPGGCHGVQARRPVEVNRAIDEFLSRYWPRPSPAGRTQVGHRRILYLSSPIGLGHARRDVAIADEMRRLVPEAEIEWLAQPPVTRVLEERGEQIHPASPLLESESAHIARHLHGHELHALRALRDMNELLAANFFVFQEVVESGGYALVVGDEAWDVDHFWHEAKTAKAARFAWLTDMVGVVPIPEKGARDVEWASEWNAQMIDHVESHPDVRDVSVFIGDPDDVIELPFGPGLPSMREWSREKYRFSGYVIGLDPARLEHPASVRDRFGIRSDEMLCVAAVGGAGVGASLLETVIRAHSVARRELPALRTLAVAGPRIEPARLPWRPGVERLGYVPDLHHLLAAADLAVVQGGLSTTMELTAARVPFLYAPLQAHWEQQYHVAHRLERYGAGRRIDHGIEVDELAEAMVRTAGSEATYRPVVTDGAEQVARELIDLL